MEAKNFRIGNIVKQPNRIGKVEEIWREGVKIKGFHNAYDYEHTYPIPLTKEWLLKCGGKLIPVEEDNYEYIEIEMNGRNLSADCSNNFSTLENNNFKPIKYVHELQNLFFAITGQELELKTEVIA